uniref:uncharacterized protein n=1 Tax=Centroberyx gerrardi TaxID=166262 RepID=UPI003AACD07E
MGNCCCPAASPCDTVEERSGLLQDASKVTAPTAETGVVGAFQRSPEPDDDTRKKSDEASIKKEDQVVTVQVKQSPQAGETGPAKTHENGPVQKECIRTTTPSPSKEAELKENSTNRAQDKDVKETAADNKPVESLQCTLDSPQTECTTNDQEVFTETNVVLVEEHPAAVQDKIPEGITEAAEAVCPENPSLPADILREHITKEAASDGDDDEEEDRGSKTTVGNAVSRPSGEFSHCNEVSCLPDTELPAAACQVLSSQEVSTESVTGNGPHSPSPSSASPSRAVAKKSDPENGSCLVQKEAGPEDIKSHDVSEPSPGSDSTGLNHSGVDPDSASSVREPVTTSPSAASESSKSYQDAKPDVQFTTVKEVTSLENLVQDAGEETALEAKEEEGDVPKAEENEEMEEEAKSASAEAVTTTGEDAEVQHLTGEEQPVGSASADVEGEVPPITEQEGLAEDGIENSDEDLYRGAEELSATQVNEAGPEITLPKVEDRCSLGPAVDLLSYSEREWKGNTAKSTLIRKGYKEMSQRFGSLRRVRGDNYCALRATLFQVLCHSTQLPAWLQQEDIAMLPEELEAREGLISQWTFPGECQQGDGTDDAAQRLKGYIELLQNRWKAAVGCSTAEERQQLCERVFQGGEEELGLLEALKLLMLSRAVELHSCMQGGRDVPFFCWLLFARDSSECPRTFLSNHLSRVGFSGGLEQVEMFLLGHALQCTIQVYRLYMADTEEFVTFYPDDHKEDWPSVCLVTEDDRHYNVPVVEAADLHKELASS